ncbi:hypothetical protein ACWAU3_08305 [Shewanella sp. JL219SE-S6]
MFQQFAGKKYAAKADSKYLSESHDFIICYAKNIDKLSLNRLEKGDKQNSRYKNPDNDPRGPWKAGDTLRNEVRDYAVFPVVGPSGAEHWPSDGTSWRYTKEKFAELIQDNRIWFGKNGTARPAIKDSCQKWTQRCLPLHGGLIKKLGTMMRRRRKVKLYLVRGIFDSKT